MGNLDGVIVLFLLCSASLISRGGRRVITMEDEGACFEDFRFDLFLQWGVFLVIVRGGV